MTRDADADLDGKSNEEEYLAGTNPRNAASVLRILAASQTPNGPAPVRWQSVAYKFYSLEVSTNLPANWRLIATNLPATPPFNTYSDSTSGDKAFYRVSVAPY